MFVEIWGTNAKGIQHHQTSITTNPEGTSQGGKGKPTNRIKKITNGEAHWSKQIQSKGGNHLCTNMVS